MLQKIPSKEVSERMCQQWGPLRIIHQDWSALEVDLVVLQKELITLAKFCQNITESLPKVERLE